ncbi:hypothetical protein BO78DRAFT_92854 [Aspergillus sclerotiicarbonarius CBS 121057]|uniref:Uncharacterized protein n=1 Tax=Aspergillus sclerotiicarbonarius (strain CBS 121057 / IBT 28362) TaxID=1448318 RepID=A0A319EAW3_ASPSB|nr:hypothetical protein BO78DRAFT_92854 [Aspergillus sclerotiicarbonarius CBS 121057]
MLFKPYQYSLFAFNKVSDKVRSIDRSTDGHASPAGRTWQSTWHPVTSNHDIPPDKNAVGFVGFSRLVAAHGRLPHARLQSGQSGLVGDVGNLRGVMTLSRHYSLTTSRFYGLFCVGLSHFFFSLLTRQPVILHTVLRI